MKKYTHIRPRKSYTFKNSDNDILWILKLARHIDGNLYAAIYFPSTGYSVNAPYDYVRNKSVKDRRRRTVLGIGYLGDRYDEIRKYYPDLCQALYSVWKFMIYRCYKETHISRKTYFDKNVFVQKRWHDFSTFFYDAQKLPGYNLDLLLNHKITLDKDSKQQGCEEKVYSPYTCVWLTHKEQQKYVDHYGPQKKVTLQITHPNGEITIEEGLGRISKKYNLDMKCINRVLKGKQKNTKGYQFEYVEDMKNEH